MALLRRSMTKIFGKLVRQLMTYQCSLVFHIYTYPCKKHENPPLSLSASLQNVGDHISPQRLFYNSSFGVTGAPDIYTNKPESVIIKPFLSMYLVSAEFVKSFFFSL